jgi:mono/diheme cytochrome c family protein
MAIGMNIERLSIALLLSLLASLCYADDGARVYRQYCQACHMADAKGATGAATIPALANNPTLQAATYPITVVLYGTAGMPWFNGLLTPEEIAAVVGYVRTHFGNNYTDPVTTEEVAKLRGPVPQE